MATRLENLRARRSDPAVLAKGLNEAYASIQQSEAVQYAIGAMQPVDPAYTAKTIEQGTRVASQLESRLLRQPCEYRFQGSVMSDTHIKAVSDIDLLALTKRFYALVPPLQPTYPYMGNPIQDLRDLRTDIIASLRDAFPAATVTTTGSKSVPIEGGSLTRKVDVVPADWCDTPQYRQTLQEKDRGVEILDNDVPERVFNTPFLNAERIHIKDQITLGGMRKAARLMKSLKYDAANMELSSYDIVAIAYNMDDGLLRVDYGKDLTIVHNCLTYCYLLQIDENLRNKIRVPDGHRAVFAPGHATEKGLGQLTAALSMLVGDIIHQNPRSMQKLTEARVEY